MTSELKKVSTGRKFLGSIVLFLVFAALVMIWRHFSPTQQTLDEKRGEERIAKRLALQKQTDAKLLTYAWVNKDKGIVQIPIDKAMALVVPVLAAKPVKPSDVKVENPYPYGLQDVVAPAAPAASGTAVPAPSPAASGSAAPAPAASGTTAPPPAPAPATSGSAAPVPAATGSAAPPAPAAATPTPGQ